jgi:hypothetical protein
MRFQYACPFSSFSASGRATHQPRLKGSSLREHVAGPNMSPWVNMIDVGARLDDWKIENRH